MFHLAVKRNKDVKWVDLRNFASGKEIVVAGAIHTTLLFEYAPVIVLVVAKVE